MIIGLNYNGGPFQRARTECGANLITERDGVHSGPWEYDTYIPRPGMGKSVQFFIIYLFQQAEFTRVNVVPRFI